MTLVDHGLHDPDPAAARLPRPGRPPRARRSPARALGRGTRRHAGLLVLLALAVAARAAVVLAYDPALWFPDSTDYVRAAQTGVPLVHRPFGYSAFLALLDGLVPYRGVALVQHGLGLVSTVLGYALLVHRGVRRRWALLAAAPVALDAYVLDIEHFVLAEALFTALLAGAVTALLWKERPGALLVGLSALLLSAFTLTRTVGTFVLLVVAVYLVVRVVLRTLRWTALVAFAVVVAATLVPYAQWFASTHGTAAITDYTGHFLYGRTSNFVRCDRLDVPERLQGLCPLVPPEERPIGDYYVWDVYSPANYAPPGGTPRYTDEDLKAFSLLAIEGQPLDFLAMTAGSTVHYFLPLRASGSRDTCPVWWVFPDAAPDPASPEHACLPLLAPPGSLRDAVTAADTPPTTAAEPGLVRPLQWYQVFVVTPGPVLGLCALAGLLALVLPRGSGGSRARLDPALLSVVGLTLLAVPSATAAFDYRYLLPTLVVLPTAAALAALRAPGGLRRTRKDTPA